MVEETRKTIPFKMSIYKVSEKFECSIARAAAELTPCSLSQKGAKLDHGQFCYSFYNDRMICDSGCYHGNEDF